LEKSHTAGVKVKPAAETKKFLPALSEYMKQSHHGNGKVTNIAKQDEFVDLVIRNKADHNIENNLSNQEPDRDVIVAELNLHQKIINRRFGRERSRMYNSIKHAVVDAINVVNVAFGSCRERFENEPEEVLQGLNFKDLIIPEEKMRDEKKRYLFLFVNLLFNVHGMRQWAVDLFMAICRKEELSIHADSFGLIISIALHADMYNPDCRLIPSQIMSSKQKWSDTFCVSENPSSCNTLCMYGQPMYDENEITNEVLREDDEFSYVEVQKRADESDARYLIYRCNNGTCKTTHSGQCMLSGIEVSKADESKFKDLLDRQADHKKKQKEGKEEEKEVRKVYEALQEASSSEASEEEEGSEEKNSGGGALLVAQALL
jgi:hypothetical protein